MSLSFWPSLYHACSLLVIWFGFRAIAGRTVLPARRFVRFAVLGMVGAGLASLLVQRVLSAFADVDTVSWTGGPLVEEVFKALPVLVLVLVLRDGHRLAIGDAVMAGVSTGLGFQFVEGNFGVLTSGEAGSWHEAVWPLSYPFGVSGNESYFMGHGVTAGLVALAAIVGLRVGGRALGALAAALALALVTFGHIIYNWKAVTADFFFGELEGVQTSSDPVEWVHDVTLQGRLVFFLLLFGTLAAVWWEGRRCTRALAGRMGLVLDDEWVRPVTVVEWTVAVQRIPAGRRVVTGTLAFFRQRRAYALAILEARDQPYLAHLDERLAHRLDELRVPSDGRWLPPARARRSVAARFVRRTLPAIVAGVALVVFFSVAVTALGDWTDRIYSNVLAFVLCALGAVFAVWRVTRFLRRPRPDRGTSDGDALVAYHAQAMMLGTGFFSSAFGFIALVSVDTVVAGAQFVTLYASDWTKAGGSMAAAAGVASLLASGTPDPPDPCQSLADEAANADDDLAALEAEAAALEQDALATYANAVAKGMDPSALGRDGVVGYGMSMPSGAGPLKPPTDSAWLAPVDGTAAAAAAAGAHAAPAANADPAASPAPAASPQPAGDNDDTIFVMSDGVRLHVPIRITPPHNFGATRAMRGIPQLTATIPPPEQVIQELVADGKQR